MNPRPSPGLLAHALALTIGLLLAGCGPSGGGTGTGNAFVPLSAFGATAASTCTSALASALDCGDSQAVMVDAAGLTGTGEVIFGDSGSASVHVLRLQGNRAALESRCGRPRFDGTWGLLPDGQARFFGTWQPIDGVEGQRAHLVVQALPAGLQVSVLDAGATAVLLGPLLLQRLEVEPFSAPSCP